ncbi:hypothetical protein SteCoe_8148 [Stentor coeruleus]|uniref:Uncharacterized protein n=1 Tax=Stentor coeruleus TaxID=5963 RepID=A0A1R2CKX0_9CILI|nr:hypothetical protein SteCoe_8148 [Stentor coeruleus]
MDFYEIDDKSSPDSWSTCDLSSQQDTPAIIKQELSEKCGHLKRKNSIKSIFSTLKSFANSSKNDPNILADYINSVFEDESPDNLCIKLNYKCCNLEKHGTRCMKKWKEIQEALITMANECSEKPKQIFSIKKRKNQISKVLLDKSQPSWIHRLFLQSLLVLGNN